MGIRSMRFVFCLERGGDAFTAGLYLFMYADMLKSQLERLSQSDVSFAGITASPNAWAVGLLLPITFLISCFEIPSGYFADRVGPKWAVVTAWLFRGGFFLAWTIALGYAKSAHSFLAITYFSTILFAIGYTLRSGANQSWLTYGLYAEGLAGKDLESVRNSINNLSVLIYWIVTLAGSLLAISVSDSHPVLPFVVGSIACILYVIILSFIMKNFGVCNGDEEAESVGSFNTWSLASRWLVLMAVAIVAGTWMVAADFVDHTWLIVNKNYVTGSSYFGSWPMVIALGVASVAGSCLVVFGDNVMKGFLGKAEVLLFSAVAFVFGISHIVIYYRSTSLGMIVFLVVKEVVRGIFDGPKDNIIQGLIPERNLYRTTIVSCVNQFGNLMVAGVIFYTILANVHDIKFLLWLWACVGCSLVVASSVLVGLIRAVEKGGHPSSDC